MNLIEKQQTKMINNNVGKIPFKSLLDVKDVLYTTNE